MYYLPKRDLIYAFVIWILPIILLPFLAFSFSILFFLVFIAALLLSFWIWNSTWYRIENGKLFIKCWIFKKTVNIKNIVSIRKTNNIYSSYALSSVRLEIIDNSKSKFYIAPIDFDNFIKELKMNNSSIAVEQ